METRIKECFMEIVCDSLSKNEQNKVLLVHDSLKVRDVFYRISVSGQGIELLIEERGTYKIILDKR